jgi:predicted AlkP superfamily phosphohydrolase/phosphomutase
MTAGTRPRVLVIGLDGLEPRIVGPMLAAGALPNLARLRAAGGYAQVATTYPAQTPVAWSSFATGLNPGGHGIYDFLRRDPATYLPDIALSRYEQKNAFTPPKAVNRRQGETLWDVLGKAGIPSTVLRCPCTYPAESMKGHLLAGVGVPDIRGGFGTPTWYTTDGGTSPGESEHVVRITLEGDKAATHLIGPRVPRTGGDAQLDITVEVDRPGRRVVIQSPGTPRRLEVVEGQWSDWLHVKFKLGLLQSAAGIVRFHLRSLEPFGLYASPVNFAADAPLFPISAPWDYAGVLEHGIGTYYTAGMPEDHTGLMNGRLDEAAYLAQCELVMQEREAMLFTELEKFDRGFLFCLFDTPDRIQHMFWRFREPDHPANRVHGFDPAFTDTIEEHYRRCDAIVGRALEAVGEDALVIVLSDHGFTSFQRGVHLNAWLLANGYLALKTGVEPGEAAGDFLRQVDWSTTRAYALGLGSIYLNLRGREASGIVSPAEAGPLGSKIAAGLTGLEDPERGGTAIRSVQRRDKVYRGACTDDAPDLLVCCEAGYRASWSTVLGGVPDALFEDNTRRWSGDHIVDPALVPGVLFMNRPFRDTGPSMLDLAPTVLGAFGVPRGDAMEGESLLP